MANGSNSGFDDGDGGDGGRGGGAAGNAGVGGYVTYQNNTVYKGDSGAQGYGYNPNNTGQKGDSPANATLVNFADGTSTPVARAGTQGVSGNVGGFLIYYRYR